MQPEIEIGRFLTEEAGFANTPPLLGAIEHVDQDGTSTALAAAFGLVRNQGDGWVYTTEYLQRVLDELRLVAASGRRRAAAARGGARLLSDPGAGARPAHRRAASGVRDPDRRPGLRRRADQRPGPAAPGAPARAARLMLPSWRSSRRSPPLDEADRQLPEILLERRAACNVRIDQLGRTRIEAAKTRLHGDYHLGQVLVAQNDFYIIDFEGEPAPPARGAPRQALAAQGRGRHAALVRLRRLERAACDFAEVHPGSERRRAELAERWRRSVEAAFLDAYRETIAGCPSYPEDADQAQALLDLFLLEKALYEICYEAANRPGWLRIPLRGVAGLLSLERPARRPGSWRGLSWPSRMTCAGVRRAGARRSRRSVRRPRRPRRWRRADPAHVPAAGRARLGARRRERPCPGRDVARPPRGRVRGPATGPRAPFAYRLRDRAGRPRGRDRRPLPFPADPRRDRCLPDRRGHAHLACTRSSARIR